MNKEEEIKSFSSVSDLPESLKDKIMSQEDFEVIHQNFDQFINPQEIYDLNQPIYGFQKKKFPLESNLENIVEESLQEMSEQEKESVKVFSFCKPYSLKSLQTKKENKTSMSALHRPSPKFESLKKSGFTTVEIKELIPKSERYQKTK